MNSEHSKTTCLRHPRTRTALRGVALVTVLWLILLLTLLGACILAAARSERVASNADMAAAEHQAHVDGALALTVQALSDLNPQRANHLHVPMTYTWSVGDETLEVRVENETSRIDLNAADEPWLTALLVNFGVTAAIAEREALHLRYWSREQPGSQTWADHVVGDALPVGSLQRVDEAARVSPVWRRIVQCRADMLTVYTGNRVPLASDLSPEMASLLDWAQRQRWGGYSWPTAVSSAAMPQNPESLAGRVLRLVVRTAEAASEGRSAYEQVVRITGDPSQPALVMYAAANVTPDTDCGSGPPT